MFKVQFIGYCGGGGGGNFETSRVLLALNFQQSEKRLNRDTKLSAILKQQYSIMLTALEENVLLHRGLVIPWYL